MVDVRLGVSSDWLAITLGSVLLATIILSCFALSTSAVKPVDRSDLLDRASAGLESVISKALHQAPAAESPLLAWPVVCGSAVAERTRAVHFAAGVLRVEVSDRGWQRELMELAPRYVGLINRYSSAAVNRIEFVVKG